jgi:hypothetical protein
MRLRLQADESRNSLQTQPVLCWPPRRAQTGYDKASGKVGGVCVRFEHSSAADAGDERARETDLARG